jgi:hypothetical protein
MRDCGRAVSDIGMRWARAHGLPILKNVLDEGRVLQHVGNGSAMDGFFELLYDIDPTHSKASIAFNLVSKDGVVVHPDTSQLGIDRLTEDLDAAVCCSD